MGRGNRNKTRPQVPKSKRNMPRRAEFDFDGYRGQFEELHPVNVPLDKLPMVRRQANSAFSFLPEEIRDRHRINIFRGPAYLTYLQGKFSRLAISKTADLAEFRRLIDKLRKGYTEELPYVAEEKSAHIIPGKRPNEYLVFASPDSTTEQRIRTETIEFSTALGIEPPKPPLLLGLGDFFNRSLAEEFTASVNKLVLPTSAELVTFEALRRYQHR